MNIIFPGKILREDTPAPYSVKISKMKTIAILKKKLSFGFYDYKETDIESTQTISNKVYTPEYTVRVFHQDAAALMNEQMTNFLSPEKVIFHIIDKSSGLCCAKSYFRL